MKKIFLFIFLTILYANESHSKKIEVTDFRGKKITMNKPAQRVVCLIESALTGIYMIGAQDTIVGISTNIYSGDVFSQYSVLDERIKNKKIPAPGNWDFGNLESIIALKPDIVIVWSEQKELIENIEKYNIPVYGVFIKKIDDVYKEIEDFGKIFGKEKIAKELIDKTSKEIAKIKKDTSKIDKRKKVYFMWAQSIFNTSCGDSIVNELIEIAGGVNVCKEIYKEHVVINVEKLKEWDPDVIIMWFNEKKDPNDIINEPLLKGIRAVKNKEVYEYKNIFYYDMWTLKFIYAIKAMSKYIYPERFKIDLNNEAKRIMRDFYRKDI
ncbi:MAG: ABC transporter substrate-binding protein [Proteobacteria bacterium]|nr:ABC transporter substrate-binding protein [Pseudomonadota bacterium]